MTKQQNQLTTVSASLVYGDLTEQDVVTVRETIGKDCNESQFKLFMSICKSSGANPILNEIYPAVRGGQLTVQFGIDFYVRKAKEHESYLGYDVQLVHENDEFKMHQEKGDDGRYFMVIDDHSFGFPRGRVVGGYAIAYREGLKPFTVIMETDEVEHYKKSNIGMQKTMWTNNFNDMFKKHMTRRALKGAFDLKFEEDGVQAETAPSYEPGQRKDITPNTIAVEGGQVLTEEEQLAEQWSIIKKLTKGWGEDDLKSLIAEKYNKKPKDLSLQEVVGLAKYIELAKKESEKAAVNDDVLDIDFEEN
ncbi:RecT family recombinase [Fictibacillus fluitans]|uniref:RecT family recombinase n=1 Tax=Fictibacillus fluitans TaxID=3058422 RepID=A0ABT8HX41_9BACL|nr:RecT family recombinase [Fictibacillus sp. NE201]MDN4525355.1 RecT family recombinase [Fictibacillus sp. NE201]